MKIIQLVSDRIEEELEDAWWYAENAILYKEDCPHLADTFSRISEEEMRHMNLLHAEVVSLIEQYRKEKGEPPAEMLAVYDYLHKRQINKASEVKVLQGMYKG